MRYIRYKQLSVAVFTPLEQQAILQASQHDPWALGRGTALVLSTAALATMHLPPVARFSLHRAGVCVYGYSSHLVPLLEEVGGSDLSWWGWPEAGIALFAAGWSYQQALDDPLLRTMIHRLFALPSSSPASLSSTPFAFPALVPMMSMHEASQDSQPVTRLATDAMDPSLN